jgi:hypothetical protein
MGKWRPAPIADGAFSDDSAPWSSQDLCGWIPRPAEQQGTRSAMQLAPLPGLQEFAYVPDTRKQRGGYVAEGRLVFVADTTLYQCMPNGSLRTIGTIPGTSRCSFAHNGVSEVLIVNGSSGYIWNWDDDTLTQITDEGFPGGLLAAYIASLFVVIDPTRRYFQNSALNDGANWNALETYQGESKPDRIKAHAVLNGEYVLLNERSLDHFAYTGVTNALFENKQIPIDRGCAATHAVSVVDNALCFIGDDGSAYAKRGYQLQRISTGPIEQAWSRCDLSKAFSFCWEDRGHKVWYITFSDGMTWGYDFWTQKWHRRQSEGMTRWRLAWLVKWRDHWYGGEYNSGRVMRLDWAYQLEGADRILRRRVSGVAHDNQNRLTFNALEVVVDASGEATTATSALSLIFDPDQQEVGALTIGGGLPDGAVGDTVNFQYRTIGGTGPVTFAVTSGTLPAGTSMTPGGLITGTYTTANNDNTWTVTATDASGDTATKAETHYVLDMLGDPPDGGAASPYSFTFTGSEGTAPYTFAKTAGTLPNGLTLASDGELSGTPTVEDDFTFSVTITDAAGVTQTKQYTVTIAEFFLSLGPIAWWKLDEGSGTTLVDQIAARNGTHSSFGGATSPAYSAAITDHSDGSLTCNGVGGQVAANSVFDVATGIGEWAVCCSFQFTGSDPTIYAKEIFANVNTWNLGRRNWYVYLTTGMLLSGAYTVSGGTRLVQHATPIVVGDKHRVWLKRESDGAGGYDLALYLDGTEVDRQPIPSPYLGAFYAGSDGIYFGNGAAAYNPNNAWAGPISDCAIFDYAVSDADIAADATYFAAVP